MRQRMYILALTFLAIVAAGCSSNGDEPVMPTPDKGKKIAINISASVTRATETAFEIGDAIGLYVVNHAADGSRQTLLVTGNQVDNARFTFNGSWTPDKTPYYKDDSTYADFYI